MKRLILDHFRRWCWLLAVSGMLILWIGWFVAKFQDNNFCSWGFILALSAGAILLSFDLQRGFARAVAMLPLTAGQIGRSWWLATVAIPAIALSMLLLLGAGFFYYCHTNESFPWGRLAMTSLFNLLWLGIIFTCVVPRSDVYGNRRQRVRSCFVGTLPALMIFGGLFFFQDAAKKPFQSAIFLGAGVWLTLVGWFCAERFVLGRASFRLAAMQSNDPRGQHRAPGGYGGIAFLIRILFVRIFLIGLAVLLIMPLMIVLQGRLKSWHQAIETLLGGMGNGLPFCFVIFFMLIPSLMQLRFLRTLPIPATRLAIVLIAMALLPLIALGALMVGFAGWALGTPTAIMVSKCYVFILAPVSLSVFFAVWRGVGIQTYALMLLFTTMGFQIVPLWLQVFFHYREIPFGLAVTFAAVCVLSSFLLTRGALIHSSRAYRVQANPFGSMVWGTSR
jgi:hypothetical protein